ncbi:MAG: hypothetical protein L3V56_08745 [Candidatus Magnetoovum sp. WYHC-5]|nr:hypothetical protein [Candidatus Magnetoovum sp. WYHC-5]
MEQKIRSALISVSDKTGLVDIGRQLVELSIRIISTGGTAKALKDAGVDTSEVSDYTGFPEILDGRVKTLHPKIHGGLLARRNKQAHMDTLHLHGIFPIDMVIVNLYPFEQTIAKKGTTLDEALENIDIGGPSMLRSAAKNFMDVVVIVEPTDYTPIVDEIKSSEGLVSIATRKRLAQKVFALTSTYDAKIAEYLRG